MLSAVAQWSQTGVFLFNFLLVIPDYLDGTRCGLLGWLLAKV